MGVPTVCAVPRRGFSGKIQYVEYISGERGRPFVGQPLKIRPATPSVMINLSAAAQDV
jgi:hypothetical protein